MTFQTLLIGLIALLLVIIVLSQISKIGDLMRNLVRNQEKAEEDSANMIATIFVIIGVVGITLLVISYFAAKDRFLPEAASELGRQFTKSFNFYSIFIVVIFFITHFLLFLFSYKYRYKVGRVVHYFPESIKLEMIWTTIPLIVLVLLGISTTGKWLKATSKPSENAMHIRITGMQFKWFIAYSGDDGEFGDRDVIQHGRLSNLLGLDPADEEGYDDLYADEVVVPVNQEVVFDISALDVIHDFYLPHFRVKMDAIPGVPTRLKITPDKTTEEMREITGNPNFEFEIACAELCGTGHWSMKKVLRVVSQEEYEAWLDEQLVAKELYYDAIIAELAEEEEQNKMKEMQKKQEHLEEEHATETASL